MRVLVCDDDPAVGEWLAAMFRIEGWAADVVDSGETCLVAVAVAPAPHDALVVDQVMPGLSGLQVAEQLREGGFTRPIVLASAQLGPEHRSDIRRLGLLTANKIDAAAVIRAAREAVLEHRPVTARRTRQVWPD